ncbi:MAG TPA: hypothetical protein VFT04_07085 [Gemmatimonadales bacterium]|nr:hypothetical protein [Gemmatimonadales bacterium]
MPSRPILLGSALVFGSAGLALLFAPSEILRLLAISDSSSEVSVLAQLLGSAWIGLAYGNWIARGLAIGGIHGRAIVVGNLVSSTTGALVVLRAVISGAPAAAWVLSFVLAAVAAAFGWLMRTPPGAARPPA